MTHIVEPLFIEWDRFARSHHSRAMLANLRFNRAAWQTSGSKKTSCDSDGARPCDTSISRRHSLPDNLSAASNRSRRTCIPVVQGESGGTAFSQLDALIECSPPYDNGVTDTQFHFRTTCEPLTTRRRRSLNSFLIHRQPYFMTSSTRKRSRSLVTSLSALFHAQAIGEVTSSKHRISASQYLMLSTDIICSTSYGL